MTRKLHAAVAGTRPVYKLIMSPEARAAGFYNLDGAPFTSYRAAQCIANAIKAYMAARVKS